MKNETDNSMATDHKKSLAPRLEELMKLMHWSRSDMAKIAGVSPTSVTNWFKRETISKESAAKLAQAAKVSLTWLITGVEDEKENSLSEDEDALIAVFRELPPVEQRNMLAAFQMRLQQLKEFYKNHVDPATRVK